MAKYRLQWPFEVVDCYDCGKGLHFRKPWERVYKPSPLSAGAMEMIASSARIMAEHNASFKNLDKAQQTINESVAKTITIPKVGNW